MHILMLSRYYYPEKSAPSVCVGETAKRLVTMGHQVTVLTTVPNYPMGIVPKEYHGRLLQEEWIEGVRVIRAWSYVSPNKGFFKRILSQLSFGCLAPLIGGRAVGKPDIIIVESPPLFNVIAAHVLGWWKRCPFIFWVADLWPESAVQLGVLKNKTFIKLAEWLEWTTYRRAALVWTVTEGMHDTLLKRGLTPEHLILIHNGVDTTRFCPYPQQDARLELRWGEEFIVLYAGTHGLTHGLTTVLEAAERLRTCENIRFVLVGDGAEKESLVQHARQRHLENVLFLDPIPHDQMPMLLAAADVCLAHTRKLPLFEGMMPMKMYEAMACGRPLLLALNGDARRIAEQEASGALYVEPENAEALAAAVLHLYEHPELKEQLGQQGRAYVQTHFDYDLLTAKVEAQLHRFRKRPAQVSVSGLPVYEEMKRVLPPLYLCWHKVMDLTFGLSGLLILCLVLPILAALIYIDSPGPIFFSQERAGHRGRVFRILKFRSMFPDARHAKNKTWVKRGDTRITRFGRILRSTHLDELPQAINVLRGDMSLIGPRPERPEFVAELEKSNYLYKYRLSIKPGITGWAQVMYGYGNAKQDELLKLQYDLYYLKHQSFLLDVLILLKTIVEVVLCHGV